MVPNGDSCNENHDFISIVVATEDGLLELAMLLLDHCWC